jgi:carboxypeptidase Taq
MPSTWDRFSQRMAELRDLAGAIGILTWDQETFMPKRGVAARSEQLGTLQAIAHERLTAPELGELLEKLAANKKLSGPQHAMVRSVRFDRQRAVKIPGKLVRELAERQSHAVEAWKEAREKKAFGIFSPHLDKLLAIRREMADAYGVPKGGERYDALLDGYEEGMRVKRLAPLFERLKGWLVPLVQALADAPPPRDDFLKRRYDPDKQWLFSLEILDAMGFDLDRGRQDRSAHPFTMGVDPDDVRLTIRIFEELPLSAIFSTIHEAGHGLYEQGLPREHRRTALCAAPSMGLHESQSRLWENLVGRSMPFWESFLPQMRVHFPEALANVRLRDFYAAVNRVERSPIRVEADEVTYNLHILLRFDLELAMLREELDVTDLPGVWNERMSKDLGVKPKNDGEGVLQDIHWAWGELGYFPTYTIGNLYAASLYDAAKRSIPGLEEHIRQGRLATLLAWLREKVHTPGRLLPAEEVVRSATGKGLDDGDFKAYLEGKYGTLYGVKV